MNGRWTMVVGSEGELLAAHEGAATEDYDGLTPVPVVPCDEAAVRHAAASIEAEVKRRNEWYGLDNWTFEEVAEWILTAAGATP